MNREEAIKKFEEIKKILKPKVISRGIEKEGKGFSREELKEVGLSLKQAIKLKIPVDKRRKTKYEENVKILKSINLNELKEIVKLLPKKRLTRKKRIELARKNRKRVFRGLTSAGKKMRGLRKLKLKETHKAKWKKKRREEKRMLKPKL